MKIKYRRFGDNDYTEVEAIKCKIACSKIWNELNLRIFYKPDMPNSTEWYEDINNVCEVYIEEI